MFRERSSHLCDQTRPTSRSTEQDKQTEIGGVYGRGLPLAEVSEKPWGEVTICNLEALRREDPVEVKVWQWLVRSVTHTVCKHVYVCGQDSEQQKAMSPNNDYYQISL